MSDSTVAQIAAGSPIQLQRGRQRTPLAITVEEVEAIREETADLAGLIDDMKGFLEAFIRPRAFAVHDRLKGREPELVPGYWPTVRNLDASPDVGLAEGFRGLRDRYLENAGFLKPVTGGRTPLVVKDVLSTFIEHVDHALKVIHLAEPIRDAASVLRNQRTVEAINARFGARMNEFLQTHLVEASLVNRDSVVGPDRLLRALNSNLVATFLTTNEGTWIRQLGGLFKLWAFMPARDFAAGLAGIRPGTLREMMNESGFLWSRYQGDSYSRFSPLRGSGLEALDATGLGQSLGGLTRAAVARDVRGVGKSWQRFLRSIKILDWFDAIVARVAWQGYKSQARRLHPEWTSDQVLRFTAQQSALAIRSTQNTSSPLDATTLATQTRNSPLRYFLLFTTDPLKSYNLIVRSMHQGPTQGAKAALAVLLNNLWSGFIATGALSYLYASFGALLSGDDDEERRIKRRAKALEQAIWRSARDIAGTVYFGDQAVVAIEAAFKPFKRGQFGSAPLLESVQGLGDAATDLVLAIDALSDDEKDEFSKRMLRALRQLWESASPLVGNPLLMPYYRARKVVKEAMAKGDEDELVRSRR